MQKERAIMLLILLSVLAGCRGGYAVEEGKVYYYYANEAVGQQKQLMRQADAGSFQKLKFDCGCSFYFGRDKQHLFIDGEELPNIDPNSFKFLGNYVFADKDSAYFFGFYSTIGNCAIRGIDLKKLQLIEYPWSKAGNILIYGHDTMTLDDINDFRPLNEHWGKTKKYIVNEGKIVAGADVKSFQIANDYTGRDKYHTYEFGEIKK